MPTTDIRPQFNRVIGLPLIHAGKVRELYALPDRPSAILMVATDNISAFDWVLPTRIPGKGAILNQMSLWWFDQLKDIVANHVVDAPVPGPVADRAVVCQLLEMIGIECVARGYLTGSGWEEYQKSGSVCGISLPAGLTDGARLPEPLFTPATKAKLGDHDENIDFATVVDMVGRETAEQIRDLTLTVYATAERTARERGIILADTKLEFGKRGDGTLVLADEVLTPDSSRFWEAETWPDSVDSFDKQIVRNWLIRESGWDRNSGTPPPPLPDSVVVATRDRYAEAYERLTGQSFR